MDSKFLVKIQHVFTKNVDGKLIGQVAVHVDNFIITRTNNINLPCTGNCYREAEDFKD